MNFFVSVFSIFIQSTKVTIKHQQGVNETSVYYETSANCVLPPIQYPNVIKTFPMLLSSRHCRIKHFGYLHKQTKHISMSDILKYLDAATQVHQYIDVGELLSWNEKQQFQIAYHSIIVSSWLSRQWNRSNHYSQAEAWCAASMNVPMSIVIKEEWQNNHADIFSTGMIN